MDTRELSAVRRLFSWWNERKESLIAEGINTPYGWAVAFRRESGERALDEATIEQILNSPDHERTSAYL